MCLIRYTRILVSEPLFHFQFFVAAKAARNTTQRRRGLVGGAGDGGDGGGEQGQAGVGVGGLVGVGGRGGAEGRGRGVGHGGRTRGGTGGGAQGIGAGRGRPRGPGSLAWGRGEGGSGVGGMEERNAREGGGKKIRGKTRNSGTRGGDGRAIRSGSSPRGRGTSPRIMSCRELEALGRGSTHSAGGAVVQFRLLRDGAEQVILALFGHLRKCLNDSAVTVLDDVAKIVHR